MKEVQLMIKRKYKKIKQIIINCYKKYVPKKPKHNFAIAKTAIIEKKELTKIGNFSEIKDFVIIRTYNNLVEIGQYTQINPFTVIYGGSGVYIGNNVMIAPHCMIASGNHDFIQTAKPMRFAGSVSKGPIVIEDNVWIGANCTITDGVKIGKDSVVAANSVVVEDVLPYDIVGGVPAKVIRSRLDGTKLAALNDNGTDTEKHKFLKNKQ